VCLLATFQVVYAQTIVGTVQDQETHQALPYTSISLGKRGVLTDSKGAFILSFKESDWEHNLPLTVRHVGYHTYQLPIKSFKNRSTITLQPQSKELQEVIVSSSARELIKKALDAIPNNYQSKDFVIAGNFIQTVRRSKFDTVFQINYRAKTKMTYDKNLSKKTEVELVSYKKTDSRNIDSSRYLHWKKDGKIIEFFDFVMNHDDFLDPQKLQKYTYQLQDIREINGYSTYHIKFELKRKPKQYAGNIFIDEESLAIIAFDFIDADSKETNDEEILKEENSLLYGKTTYKKIGDFWYIDSLQYAKSSKLMGQLGYISVQYKTDDVQVNQSKLFATYQTRITSDVSMERLADQITLFPNPNLPTSGKDVSNLKKSIFNKLHIHYLLGASTTIYPITFLDDAPWDKIEGLKPPTIKSLTLSFIQSGFALQIKSLRFSILSNFNFFEHVTIASGHHYDLAYEFNINQSQRPIVLNVHLGKNSFRIRQLLNSFTPSNNLQRAEDLSNEPYKARHQISVEGYYTGVSMGIHLTRTKIIGLGLTYNIPYTWSEELNLKKESNNFIQNLLGIHSKTMLLPFNTIQQIPNQFSLNLTYQL
jgi:hypothetical protein